MAETFAGWVSWKPSLLQIAEQLSSPNPLLIVVAVSEGVLDWLLLALLSPRSPSPKQLHVALSFFPSSVAFL